MMNMGVCQNVSVSVSVSGECQQEQVQVLAPSCSKLSTSSCSLDDLFSAQNTEVDVGLEWLSVFVEDCFSSPPSCVLGPSSVHATTTITSKKPSTTLLKKRPQQQQQNNESSLTKFSVPGKARSKRKRLSAPRTTNYRDPLSIWSHNLNLNPSNESLMISDPPLLKQEYWLADSELFVPKQKQNNKEDNEEEKPQGVVITKECEEEEQEQQEEVLLQKGIVMRKESFGFGHGYGESENEGSSNNGQNNNQLLVPRRCTHCLAQRTPQWRAGPLGPKTLCNACGVRYKSGRLLPEYRPAKSPTFVSYLHSNSHKKVMEMRMHGSSSSILHS